MPGKARNGHENHLSETLFTAHPNTKTSKLSDRRLGKYNWGWSLLVGVLRANNDLPTTCHDQGPRPVWCISAPPQSMGRVETLSAGVEIPALKPMMAVFENPCRCLGSKPPQIVILSQCNQSTGACRAFQASIIFSIWEEQFRKFRRRVPGFLNS